MIFQTDTLKEVIINGKLIPGNNKSINPSQKLSGASLERTNSLSVADAVRHLSGVQLKDYGGVGGLKTINVRNLGSLHTAVFYDDIQLGNAQNGQIDLGKLSLDNIEVIELYNGQSNKPLLSARAYALSSSLFLESKKPEFNTGKDKFKLALKTGSFGLVDPSVTWYHKLGTNVYTSLSTEYQKADGKYKFHYIDGPSDSLLTRDNGNLEALRSEAAILGIAADSSKWSVRAYTYTSKRGLPSYIVRNNFTSKQKLWDDDIYLQASYLKKVTNLYQIALRSKYSYSYNRYSDSEFFNDDRILINWYRQTEYYFSVANRYAFSPKVSVSLSTDVIRNWMDAKIDFGLIAFAKPTRITALTALEARFELKNIDIQASVLNTLVHDKVRIGESASDKKELSPTISASWKPFDKINFNVRGFYKDSFRLPTFNDQYYSISGNLNLKPEYTSQYNFGISFIKALPRKWKYISFRADGYYNKIKDKIVALPTKNLFLWSMMNIGNVEVKGLESAFNSAIELNDAVTITANINYTFQKAIDVTPGSINYNDYIPYSPKHCGSTTIGLEVKKLLINYNFIYTGERYGLRPNTTESYMQPWYTHDISMGYKITSGKTQYKLLGEVNNLLDQSYDVVRNYPMPGRSFRITLSTNF